MPKQNILDLSTPFDSLESLSNGPPYSGSVTITYKLEDFDEFIASRPEKQRNKLKADIEQVLKNAPLLPYIGDALVISLDQFKPEISAKMIIEHIENIVQIDPAKSEFIRRNLPPRLLIKTGFKRGANSHPCLSPDAIEYLGARGFVLIGLDTPALDPPDSSRNLIEQFMKARGLVWLLNLDLDHTQNADVGMLIAPPMKSNETGVSPARPAFITLNS